MLGNRRKFSINGFVLLLALAPLGILVFTEACSPMKAISSATKKSSSTTQTSSQNICAAAYTPSNKATTSSMSKASDEQQPTLFDQKKFHVSSGGAQKASAGPLKVTVVIDMNCQVSAGHLSDLVLKQDPPPPGSLTRRAFIYEVPSEVSLAELEDQSAQDACVLGVTHHGLVKTASLALPPFNDASFNEQSYLMSVNYAHAYEYFVTKQNGAAKARVGFVDTGADCSHPDLMGNLVSGCGFNALGAGSPTDNDGHGSHTAGIVGAVANNSVGVAGIAGNGAEIHAIRVIDVGQGTQQDVYNGIQYAIQQNLDIINISLESQSQMSTVEQGVQEAVNAGILVVMAAGNHSQSLGDIHVSPAILGKNLIGAITVGSLDSQTGSLSDFSNYGLNVEIAAPGAVNSLIAGPVGGLYSTHRGGGYYRLQGTSQAAPVVSGAAALLVQFFRQRGVSFTNADLENLLMRSTESQTIDINGGRVLNFSKLVRVAYQHAGVSLCN